MLKIKPQSPEGIALKGWVEVDLKFSQYGYLHKDSDLKISHLLVKIN